MSTNPTEEVNHRLGELARANVHLAAALAEAREERDQAKHNLQSWLDVFGHLGTANQVGNMWFELRSCVIVLRAALQSTQAPLGKVGNDVTIIVKALALADNLIKGDPK